MADYSQLVRKLSRLDSYEKAGLEYFKNNGTMLDHDQYLYLMMHGACQHTIQIMNDPPALREQEQLDLPYRNRLMESACSSLITYILQGYMDTMQPLYRISLSDQRMLDMVNYMFNHYRTITLHDLSAEFHYNESYLSRMFKERAGRSFSDTV